MLHYENKIERALDYLKSPSKLSPTGYSPIVYMVYLPEDAFVVRGLIDSFLKPKAEYMGFHAHEFSMGLVIDRFINTNDYLDIWTDPDVEEPELYNSIKQAIVNDRYIEKLCWRSKTNCWLKKKIRSWLSGMWRCFILSI